MNTIKKSLLSHTKHPIIFVLLLLTGIGVISTLLLSKISYIPPLGIQFYKLIVSKNYEEAFKLVEKNPVTGYTIQEFKSEIENQMSFVEKNRKQGKKEKLSAFPNQTYGNRLRRILKGQKTNMDVHTVTYDFGNYFSFYIRLESDDTNKWKITEYEIQKQ